MNPKWAFFLPAIFLSSILLLSGCKTSPAAQPPQISDTITLTASLTPTLSATATFTPSPSPTLTPSSTPTPTETEIPGPSFSFIVNADMAFHAGPGEYDTSQYFRGMVEKIAQLDQAHFMISVGDTTPPQDALWTINQILGGDFLWFPVVGNHELNWIDMDWLRAYDPDINGSLPPNIINRGPEGCEETNYAFDYGNAHFVILNVYCDLNNDTRTDGAIVDALYEWLKQDLESSNQKLKFVFGHETAYPQPDQDNGIIRQVGQSLDKYPITRDRFWNLLAEEGVIAYITGHTHSYSLIPIDGVWQLDVGHSMGARTQATPSTFIMIHINGSQVSYETYRAGVDEIYTLRHSGYLKE